MEINFASGMSMTNVQFGENNTMFVDNRAIPSFLGEKDWKELEMILNQKAVDKNLSNSQKLLIHKGLEYVNVKDESGFRKFLVNNKDSFLTSILSNLASTGLLALLNQWCK